ncbi:MAG: SH3 domain-containing protein [Myxococcaceae bacterium]
MNLLLVVFILGQSAPAPGPAYYSEAEAQSLFAEANAAYARGDAPQAREGFARLLAHGYLGSDIHYNLGTAYLAEGKVGPAVFHLESAARQGGHREDAAAQLAIAKGRRLDQVEGADNDEPFLERLAASTPREVTAWSFLGLWALLWILVGLRRFGRLRQGGMGVTLLSICGALFVASAVALGAHVLQASVGEAVVLADAASVRELPAETAKVTFEVHGGLKVRILETTGGFSRIRLPNGLEGWVLTAGLGVLG